jgi:predicted dinucleotide-binding enzyme
MKIGVIGSGEVGKALAQGFLKHGHQVMVGTQKKEKAAELQKALGGKAATGSFEDTARFGELVVLAVKGSAAESALQLAGAANLKGKTVIDTMNPIADQPPVNGVLAFFTSPNDSLLERLQKKAPEVRFVKAFSCIGSNLMVNPSIGGAKPSMFICGNDASAKKQVGAIVDAFGFEVEDVGGAESARAIEPLCMLWCLPGFLRNDWSHAFKVLRG